IVNVFFIRDAKYEQLRAIQTFLLLVERRGYRFDHMVGHRSVYFACQLDESSRKVVFARLPRKIKRINWNAMPAQPRSGIKRHEAERLGGGRVNHFPDV